MENRQGDQRRDGKKGGEKRRQKRTRRRVSKEDVSVPFLWRPLISSVKGDLESCGGLEGPSGEA